jgi:DNA-directed RNA polymerase specialized sigma24 family protein
VMELRLAGLTSREIGEVLGKLPNAVDQAQFRAMTRLKLLAGIGESSKGARR